MKHVWHKLRYGWPCLVSGHSYVEDGNTPDNVQILICENCGHGSASMSWEPIKKIEPSPPAPPADVAAAEELHDSDCAIFNMPDHPNEPCNCSVSGTTTAADELERRQNMLYGVTPTLIGVRDLHACLANAIKALKASEARVADQKEAYAELEQQHNSRGYNLKELRDTLTARDQTIQRLREASEVVIRWLRQLNPTAAERDALANRLERALTDTTPTDNNSVDK